MQDDEEAHRAKAREMQEGRPQWRVWWAGRRRGYAAVHQPTSQILFSPDPERLIKLMGQVDKGARLDEWLLLAWPPFRLDGVAGFYGPGNRRTGGEQP